MQSKIIAETDDMVQKIRNTNGNAEINALLSKYTEKKKTDSKAQGGKGSVAPQNPRNVFSSIQPGHKEDRKTDNNSRNELDDSNAVVPFQHERNINDMNRKKQSLGIESWASARPSVAPTSHIDASAHPKPTARKQLFSKGSNV